MTTYLLRRSLHTVLALALMLVIVFAFTHTIGDPAGLMLPDASSDALDALRESMGFKDPWYVQLGRYFGELIRLDLGTSLWQDIPNSELIMSRLPATFVLATTAIALAAGGGIVLGAAAALKPRSGLDRVVTVLSTIAVTSVDFWVALMLIALVSVELGWLPTSGYGEVKHLILPAVVVALRPLGRIAQVARPALRDALEKEYVVVARAKGLTEERILFAHAARNASITVLTLVGYEFASLIEGSVIVETVFAWPGVGFLLVQAINFRDWTLVVATTIVMASIVICLNLLVDLLYLVLDPRIRYSD